HPLFVLEFSLVKGGVDEHIRKQIERRFQLIVDYLDCKCSFLMRRECFEISAQPVLLDRDVECRAPLRSFKDSVLDKVADPCELGRFILCAGAIKKAEGRRTYV